jgi:hypothetical protein
MPNHIHTVIEIKTDNRNETAWVETHGLASLPVPTETPMPTETIMPSNTAIIYGLLAIKRNPHIRLPKSISLFMAGFKSAVNTKINDYIDDHELQTPKFNRNNYFFQPNYHDHILRNNLGNHNILNFIKSNPLNWKKDKFHSNQV